MDKLFTGVVLMSALLLSGCGGDDPVDPGDGPPPIITVTNSWGVEGEDDRFFFFQSDDDGEDTGTFVGDEDTPEGDFWDLSGAWAEGEISFTVERDEDVVYTASFGSDNPNRLVFTGGGEEVVLLLGD